MRYYFAPMEGVTGYIYRNLHTKWFGGMNKYFTPFLSPGAEHHMTRKEKQEIAKENNIAANITPQILSKNADDFIWLAQLLYDMGYKEINLNLGCPSGTVTAKGKGAGFLGRPEELNLFLEKIFAKTKAKISVKTRVGMKDSDEFYQLIQIFNQYPMEELIIHPRLQKDFYKGNVRMDCFEHALKESRNSLCYNGDLVSKEDVLTFQKKFPEVKNIMIGRGLIANPGLALWITEDTAITRETLESFHDDVYETYSRVYGSRQNAVYRMKEIWFYMIHMFEENEKIWKKMRKEKEPAKYEDNASEIFKSLQLRKDAAFGWYRST